MKMITEYELKNIKGGKNKQLTMAYQNKGYIQKIIKWFKH